MVLLSLQFAHHPRGAAQVRKYYRANNHATYAVHFLATLVLMLLATVEAPAKDGPIGVLDPQLHAAIELLCLIVVTLVLFLNSSWMGIRIILRHKVGNTHPYIKNNDKRKKNKKRGGHGKERIKNSCRANLDSLRSFLFLFFWLFLLVLFFCLPSGAKAVVLQMVALLVMMVEAVVIIRRNQAHIRITRILRPLLLAESYYCAVIRRVLRQTLQAMYHKKNKK